MRLLSLLLIISVFFAGSVSADHQCAKGKSLGGKVHQVCKNWRDKNAGNFRGGWDEEDFQSCKDNLCKYAESYCIGTGQASTNTYNSTCVSSKAREDTKKVMCFEGYC